MNATAGSDDENDALPERLAGKSAITIVDVAREADVSIRTVSRVLNGEKHVSLKKRTRVQEVIDRLAFVPSASARSLPSSRSYTLGLIFEKLSANYMMDIQLAAIEECHKSGYRLIIEEFTPEMLASVAAARTAVANLRVDAAILLPPACDNSILLDALDAVRIGYTRLSPAIALNRSAAVTMDDERATHAMVSHLVDLGHRRIGFLVGNIGHASAHRRLQAFWTAIDALGLPRSDALVRQGDYNFDSGLAAGHSLLSEAEPPTAIFASNDTMAAGVIAAAGIRGLRTPQDLSVCGFDDSPLSRHIWPSLTTIHQPLAEMTRAAVGQILAPESKKRLISFDFSLVVRASTTAPPRA
ncbi:LacI family DNA-binding transcriptional regulator [Sphingobium sp. H39-3-25]|uniref:LacI family DNA-binding transcriptional regulator n=1 Tax=Sphingobium arseniciresistens TaxID=3030834 RepID=UPI0023B8ACD8|nr:LacI family DNA-binding transcriptional regulator [Sphingobium arseniciresistens]